MKIMPMGDYYVWHCDWCDSTNYTLWAHLERQGLACAACHQHSAEFAESSRLFNAQRTPKTGFAGVAM